MNQKLTGADNVWPLNLDCLAAFGPIFVHYPTKFIVFFFTVATIVARTTFLSKSMETAIGEPKKDINQINFVSSGLRIIWSTDAAPLR